MTATPAPALRQAVRALEIPRARLLAAVLAACATLGSAFALAAVAAYLVTRAWTMPPVLDLTVAVVAVRALGVSRGAFRWLERMLTHDVALRGVVSLRTNLFTALAARTDDALTRLRRGDLLARLGDDAQELGDHVIIAVVPAAVSVVMALAVLATFAPLSPPAAGVMLAALALAGVLAPSAAHRAARLSEQAVLTTRADVAAHALEILDDATSLRVQGRLDGALAALQHRQREHDAAIDRAAIPAALASAAVPLSLVLAVVGSLLAAGALWTAGGASAGICLEHWKLARRAPRRSGAAGVLRAAAGPATVALLLTGVAALASPKLLPGAVQRVQTLAFATVCLDLAALQAQEEAD